jgi:hypothetical protein
LVEGVSEDEEHEFEHETHGRGSVNVLGQAGRELAKTRFNGFANVLQQKVFVRFVGPQAVLFAGRLLAAARGLFEHVFGHVVGVAATAWSSVPALCVRVYGCC